MKTINIPLDAITPKKGTKIKYENNELHIPASVSDLGKSRSLAYIPGKYKLPFRINMMVKAKFIEKPQEKTKLGDEPQAQLTLLVGKGRVYFNGGRVCASDILADGKKSVLGDDGAPYYVYYNHMPEKGFVDVSITFGTQAMYVAVDGVICYASRDMPYLQMLQDNTVADCIDMSLRSGTYTMTTLKSFAITEYENDEPAVPAEIADLPDASEFELFVRGLPPHIHDEAFKLDEFLLNHKAGGLKFRRTFDNGEHLIYKSSCGFNYQIPEYGVHGKHLTYWVQSAKKPDRTNEMFIKLAETSAELADRIFGKLQICNPHFRECKRRTQVTLKSKTVDVCMAKIVHKMYPSEFEDVKAIVSAVGML